MNNVTTRFLIGLIAGVLLLVLGIVRSSFPMEAVGGLLIVVCGARMLMLSRKSG
ncbi:hypothetical protein GCM10018793_68080 [Streptomyces sulfonofaciens]|uniref:Uncharacterized protein n=1 Tax=Streptomyces sulfonofaciens TaxID=68272 RepID=A0A919GPV8_9ACTN|nr:hypothetical protein [Streptomyces sulfonofaciens]GHH88431.1 hypothetical protein GCM10018793_68080 [Streptomyces sulfonofaciens]